MNDVPERGTNLSWWYATRCEQDCLQRSLTNACFGRRMFGWQRNLSGERPSGHAVFLQEKEANTMKSSWYDLCTNWKTEPVIHKSYYPNENTFSIHGVGLVGLGVNVLPQKAQYSELYSESFHCLCLSTSVASVYWYKLRVHRQVWLVLLQNTRTTTSNKLNWQITKFHCMNKLGEPLQSIDVVTKFVNILQVNRNILMFWYEFLWSGSQAYLLYSRIRSALRLATMVALAVMKLGHGASQCSNCPTNWSMK